MRPCARDEDEDVDVDVDVGLGSPLSILVSPFC